MGKHFDNARQVHFRLFGSESNIVSDKMHLITKAANIINLTISEFCRMAAVKEARYTLLEHHKQRLKIAKKIILDEELKQKQREIKLKHEKLEGGIE